MKTTLNLGSLNFNFGDSSDRFVSNQGCSPMPENKTQATLEIKDITVTFEATVEETIADIQASLECIKELKNLGSEVANLFAELQNKREARREKESFEERFDRNKKEMEEKFELAKKEIDEKFESYKAQ